jgi:hypothetical protein
MSRLDPAHRRLLIIDQGLGPTVGGVEGFSMRRLTLVVAMIVVSGCGLVGKMTGGGGNVEAEAPPTVVPAKAEGALATQAASVPATVATTTGASTTLDTGAIEEAIGLTGATMADGVFRITKPRGDLKVSLDGFPITPRMGLAGWVAFRAHASGAMLLGVMPVTTDELQAVVSALANAGLEPSALHPHFVGEEPRVSFVHFGGLGNPVALARGVRDVLDAIVRVRTARPVTPRAAGTESGLDVAKLDALLRLHGEYDGQVYRVTAPRTDLSLREMDVDLGATMSPTSWAAFQGTAERTAVAGELMLLPSEVQPIIYALREAHIGVVGIHDDSTQEEPRVVFVSFWGVGRTEALATGIRKALDRLPQ